MDKVRNDGRFLRIKTFADSVAVPMSNVILEIYKQSGNTLRESDVYFDKRQQLSEWREKFVARSQEKLDNLYKQLSEELDTAIYNFVDNHYEDDRAGEHWQQRFQQLKFDEKYQDLLKSMANECDRKRKELSDKVATELSHLPLDNARVNIHLDSATAWGQKISTALPLLALIPGIGWVGAGVLTAVGILGNIFFDSKEKQRAQNRQKLRDAITPPSRDILNQMHDKVIETFNNEILAKGVDEFSDLLASYQFMFARLGDSQSYMASALFEEFSDLNFKLLVEANNYKNIGSADVAYIPRIPGEKMLILADNSNLDTRKLSDLLGENVSVMQPEENFPDTLKKVLGSDYDVDYYPLDFAKENENAEEAIALFPKNKVDVTKFKIAQQITSCPIIAEFVAPRAQILPNVSAQRTTSSGGRQQSNAFDSDFKRIDQMFANCASNYAIRNALDALRQRARDLRNAAAMRKIADYYDKVFDSGTAFACREEVKTFER